MSTLEDTAITRPADAMPESSPFGKSGGPIRPPLRTRPDGDAAGRQAPAPRGEGTSGVSRREPEAAATAPPTTGQPKAAPTSPHAPSAGSGVQEHRDSRFAELNRLIAAGSGAKKRKPRPRSGRQSSRHPSDFGKLTKDLERDVEQFARRLRRNHAEQIARDARKFKRRAVTILRRKLPPFAGRPAGAAVTKAMELRRQGRDWKQIYPQAILNHPSLDPPVRRQAESNLRAAVRSRRNARKRRKRPAMNP